MLSWIGALLVFGCGAAEPAPRAPSAPSAPSAPKTPTPALPSDPIEVAITVDDLPRHGPDLSGTTRLMLHEQLLATFASHKTPPVYGFVNAIGLEDHPEDIAALRAWRKAGHPLANHTYSHIDGARATHEEYLADVDKNEAVLRELMGNEPEQVSAWKIFRYPYLRQGKDLAAQAALRTALRERGYRIAEVTIDFYDWAYNQAYLRCLAENDAAAIGGLEESYLDQATAELRWADGAAREVAGRPIPHILLLHVGHFTSHMMDRLLTAYVKNGARFVSLEQALADPIYWSEPSPRVMTSGNFLWQIRKSRGTRSPSVAPPPDTLLDLICR